MSRSTHDEFLAQLGELFKQSNEHGSVYLTQKRWRVVKIKEEDTAPFGVLFRATDGKSDKSKKQKYSTVVDSSDLDAFWQKYTDVVKAGMGGLRKKDKKKKKAKK